MEAEIRVIQTAALPSKSCFLRTGPASRALLKELARYPQGSWHCQAERMLGDRAGLMRWSHIRIDGMDSKAQDSGRQALKKLGQVLLPLAKAPITSLYSQYQS